MILHLFQKRISISYERTYIKPEIFSPAIVMAYQVRVNQCTHFKCRRLKNKQVCIPVGCVPSAAVAVSLSMHWAGGVYPSMH